MRCPNDEATLVMSERSGIEIDYCPECRGVWLDRGELDKIIDRSLQMPAPAQAPATPAPAQPRYEEYDERPRQQAPYSSHQQGHYKKKRKESWLSELFE